MREYERKSEQILGKELAEEKKGVDGTKNTMNRKKKKRELKNLKKTKRSRECYRR